MVPAQNQTKILVRHLSHTVRVSTGLCLQTECWYMTWLPNCKWRSASLLLYSLLIRGGWVEETRPHGLASRVPDPQGHYINGSGATSPGKLSMLTYGWHTILWGAYWCLTPIKLVHEWKLLILTFRIISRTISRYWL